MNRTVTRSNIETRSHGRFHRAGDIKIFVVDKQMAVPRDFFQETFAVAQAEARTHLESTHERASLFHQFECALRGVDVECDKNRIGEIRASLIHEYLNLNSVGLDFAMQI